MIGKRFKHYEITGSLGAGGMGVVYKAIDTRLNRSVALKFVSPQRIGSEEEQKRLVNEARAAAVLHHPNICTIYDIDEADGQVFISMAYLEGETLRDRLHRDGRLSVAEAARIARQVAEGLCEAHARGVIHRDIKSANILLTGRGEAVILDFGLAKLPADPSLTQTMAFSGTVSYSSPEQVRGERVDGRADLWSLGVVWYEMLAGVLPFPGATLAATIAAVLNQEPESLHARRPEVPGALERVIARLLAKDVARRLPDAAALLVELAAIDVSDGSPASPPKTPSIAVLPFTNMSTDAEQGYFCDGIAEDIINDLTRVEGLRVVARTTSFAYREQAGDIREIAQRLGVDSILEGSVRKAGSRLRISAQLIDAASGYHLWSERWDRDLADVFAIQDEIAYATVAALRVTLSAHDELALARAETGDLQAYELFLQGRSRLRESSATPLHEARLCLRAAVERDPDFARAHALLSLAGTFSVQYFAADAGLVHEANEAADRALALDPNLAEGRTAKALALVQMQRHEEAEREFLDALRLDPDLYDANLYFGRLRFVQQRWSETRELWERAIAIDPEEFQCANLMVTVCRALGWSDERRKPVLERAVERAANHVRRHPTSPRALYLGAGPLFELGRREEALRWLDRALQIDPNKADVQYNVACVLAVAGEAERAIGHVRKAMECGYMGMEWMAVDPDLESLRDDPRFLAITEEYRGRG